MYPNISSISSIVRWKEGVMQSTWWDTREIESNSAMKSYTLTEFSYKQGRLDITCTSLRKNSGQKPIQLILLMKYCSRNPDKVFSRKSKSSSVLSNVNKRTQYKLRRISCTQRIQLLCKNSIYEILSNHLLI